MKLQYSHVVTDFFNIFNTNILSNFNYEITAINSSGEIFHI